jgi:hypothetical protein
MSKGIIHCYGKWEVLSLPSNHTVWYIQWVKKQTKDIIGVEKQEPRGISQNYITFLK